MKTIRWIVCALSLALIISALTVPYTILAGPAPPPANTIQHDVGIYFPSINAWDYFYRGYNITTFIEAVAAWIEDHEGDGPVWESTVEWGLVYGTTGDWFDHTLPGEPVSIVLQMHPDSLEYQANLIIPEVYDKTATQWQLALYFLNGTQVTDDHDMLVMYHMRWEPGLEDPNEPQLSTEYEEPL